MARRWGAVWLGATVIVLAVTLWPLSAFRAHPHWERIAWVPLRDSSSKPWELLANVLLFVPFGYAGVRALRRSRRSAWLVTATAGLLSLAVEGAQVFAHGRYPSTTDVLTNVAGAALGCVLARRASAARQDTGGGD